MYYTYLSLKPKCKSDVYRKQYDFARISTKCHVGLVQNSQLYPNTSGSTHLNPHLHNNKHLPQTTHILCQRFVLYCDISTTTTIRFTVS